MYTRSWLRGVLFIFAFMLCVSIVTVALAQPVTPAAAAVEIDWKLILATFVNGTLVLLIVSVINAYKPVIRESYPWVVPLMATALGPVIGAAQSWALSKLGIQVDFSPIIAALAGAAATTAQDRKSVV